MDSVLALVYSSEFNESDYGQLCKVRPDYMLPFGGRYRVVDFTLSNLSNYDISNVILFAGKQVRSTLDHIGDGRSWELNRRRGGLIINPPNYDHNMGNSEIATYFEATPYFEDHNQDYVFITDPMYITKEDITDAKEKMKSEDLDVLVFSQRRVDDSGYYLNRKIINSSEDGKPVSVGRNLGVSDEFDLFAGSVMLKREVFLRVLRYAVESNYSQSFLGAIFNFPQDLKIDFYRSEKPLEIIQDIYSFYDVNLKLLDRDYFYKLFYEDGMVYTKSKDEPSTTYTSSSNVRNSLVANGAIIEGDVENSIIFRGVKIKEGAIVRNSIIFQESEIEEGAILNYVITDKYSKVDKNIKLFGNRSHPYVTAKNEVIEKRSY